MITRRNALAGCVALVTLVTLAPSAAVADAGPEPLAVVTSKKGGVSELTLYQLKRLYLGDNVRAGGLELLPLNRDAKGAERTGFDTSVLGMSAEVAARYWIDRRIRGQSGAPKSVEPAAVIQRVIANLPRAVGYVRLRDVGPDVQIVKIDGRKPGEPGYPVHLSAGGSVARFWPELRELF